MGIRQNISRWLDSAPATAAPTVRTSDFANILNTPVQDLRDRFAGNALAGTYFNKQLDLWRVNTMWNIDPYTAELVQNVVDFSVGTGIVVDFGSDYLSELLAQWTWNQRNPNATQLDLQKMAMTQLIRDGDIFGYTYQVGGAPRLHCIDGLAIGQGAGPGVELDDTGAPLRYQYQPQNFRSWAIPIFQAPASIPAGSMIHVYRQEYAEGVRGVSWLWRSIDSIIQLRLFLNAIVSHQTLAVQTLGYYTAPDRLLISYDQPEDGTPQDQAAAEAAALQALLNPQALRDPQAKPVFPEGVTWNEQKLSGLDGPSVQEIIKVLTHKIAMGLGVSPGTLTKDFSGQTYPAVRQAQVADYQFFRQAQTLLEAFYSRVIDYWLGWLLINDPKARKEFLASDGVRLELPTFPIVDPLKESVAAKNLVTLGVSTPQQHIRESGGRVDRVMEERLEWAEHEAEVREILGGPLGDVEMDKGFPSKS